MEINRTELKAQARQAMRATTPRFWVITLVYILLTTGVSLLLSLIFAFIPANSESGFSSASLFLSILQYLFTAVIGFGYTLWALWASRRMNPGLGALTQGFSISGRVILMEVLIAVRMFCWLLLVVAAFLFLMTFTPLYMLAASFPLAFELFYLLIFAAALAIMLRYALAPYLLADHPDDGPAIAIRRSVEYMRGWKMTLFKVELSFFGWLALWMLLLVAVQAAALWYFGFFQLPAPTTLDEIVQQTANFSSIISHPLTVLATTLVPLPLLLWYMPYRAVTLAGFYDLRLQAPQSPEYPTMPPV